MEIKKRITKDFFKDIKPIIEDRKHHTIIKTKKYSVYYKEFKDKFIFEDVFRCNKNIDNFLKIISKRLIDDFKWCGILKINNKLYVINRKIDFNYVPSQFFCHRNCIIVPYLNFITNNFDNPLTEDEDEEETFLL